MLHFAQDLLMAGLLLRVRPRLVPVALAVALSAISGGSASAQPAPALPPAAAQPAPPAPGQPPASAQPALPPPGTQAPPFQPSPQPAPPGAAPIPGQPWYPPQEGYQPWVYYPQYGYGYDSPYVAPPPPPKERYNSTFMTAGIVMTV